MLQLHPYLIDAGHANDDAAGIRILYQVINRNHNTFTIIYNTSETWKRERAWRHKRFAIEISWRASALCVAFV